MMRWLLGLFWGWRIPRWEDELWRHVPPPNDRARRSGRESW